MRRISREGRTAFYEGEIAAEIVEKLRSLGGLHRLEDFAVHAGNYVEPISALYRGFEIYECPPNGQGLAVLIMLRALSGYELAVPRYDEADRIIFWRRSRRLPLDCGMPISAIPSTTR